MGQPAAIRPRPPRFLWPNDDYGRTDPVRDNPTGLHVGYNPYNSGSLGKTARMKKLDLRELSKWIETKRKT